MDETNEFQYFHSYANLVSQGRCSPLTCECGATYVTVDKNGLTLWCPVDDSEMVPGLYLRMRVQELVDRNTK